MLKTKLIAFLKLRPDEVRMSLLVAAMFLFMETGLSFGRNAAYTLLLVPLGKEVDHVLPFVYMGLGAVVFLVTMAYSASLGRFQNAGVASTVLAGAVFLFLAQWLVIAWWGQPIYRTLYLTTFGMAGVLGTLSWTVAGEVTDARQAKRLFPFFASVGILGGVLGNSLAGALSKAIETHDLIVLFCASLTVVFFLTRRITRDYFKPEPTAQAGYNFLQDLRAGYDFVAGYKLFRLLAFASILFSVLFFTIEYPFNIIVSERFAANPAGLTGFNSSFTSLQAAVTFLVSLLLANRIYARLGIVNSILSMPFAYLACFIIFFLGFQFESAAAVRFVQLVMLGGVMGTAWSALFNVVPVERRGQVLAFMNGVPAQIGVILSGALLLLARQVLTSREVLLMGFAVALLAIYIVWQMRDAYGVALLDALRAGRVEVFSGEEEAFSGFKDDPAALQVILQSLRDPKPFTRRLAVEMLARTGNILALPELIERLSDDDAAVRAGATQAVVDLGAVKAASALMRGLDDPDDAVRERTLAALPWLELAPSPELTRTLTRLLKDSNITIRARAAAVLVQLGAGRRAESLLEGMLQDEHVQTRRAALAAIGETLKYTTGASPFGHERVLALLDDPSPMLRREAVPVAARLGGAHDAIARRLADEDAGVRRAASESLRRAGAESRSAVLHILESSSGVTAFAALDAIQPGDAEAFPALRGCIQREASSIRSLRAMIEAVPRKGRATALLLEALHARESACEERMLKAVGLFGNPRALELIRKSLGAGDASARAAALEALETLGDRRITREVLPILDRGGVFLAETDVKMQVAEVIDSLMAQENAWVRALALYVVSELALKKFVPRLRAFTVDPSPLVRDAANTAILRMDGTIIMKPIKNLKTLKTLSALDRILLLREVPIFSRLEPEDLEKVAEVAEEQWFASQSLLCREGEPGKTMFIVAGGRVDVIKTTGGREHVLAVRTAGEFVGEMAILESAPRSATLRANGDVRVLVIDGDAFHAILRDRPEVAISVLKHMSTRVRELNEKVGMAG